MHRFFISPEQIERGRAILTGQDARHLLHVLRLSTGAEVELVDGEGLRHIAVIEAIHAKEIALSITESLRLDAESSIHITMALGVLKEKKMESLLRPLTELGMSEWSPFFAKRSVPTPTPKKDPAKVARWERIVRESMKQCGRSLQPILHPPVSFHDLMDRSNGYDLKIFFWEEATRPIDTLFKFKERTTLKAPAPLFEEQVDVRESDTKGVEENEKKNEKRPLRIMILIGPEGGITQDEAHHALDQGFHPLSLGRRILKAETAAITAMALIQHHFGDLGKKV